MRNNGNYIDDTLRARKRECKTNSDATPEQTETTRNQQEIFPFAGMYITRSKNMYHMDHDFYINKIENSIQR